MDVSFVLLPDDRHPLRHFLNFFQEPTTFYGLINICFYLNLFANQVTWNFYNTEVLVYNYLRTILSLMEQYLL